MDRVGQYLLLTCHGPAMNDVDEAGYFFRGEVSDVTIWIGQIPSVVRGAYITRPRAGSVYNE